MSEDTIKIIEHISERLAKIETRIDALENTDCKKTDLLACDCCGWIERAPFVDGDTCICGGTFRSYDGKIKLIGNIEFTENKVD